MIRRTFVALSAAAIMATSAFADGHSTSEKDIVTIAVENGNFTTLVAAVQAAGLVDTLQGDGPFTVFAPTDDAFAALPDGTVEALLNDIPTLQAILTYHVVPTKVMASDLAGQTVSAKTVNGEKLIIDGRNGVKVNDATVTAADIVGSNGVIHVVDSVILPAS